MNAHPWSILPSLVTAEILTTVEAKRLVLAHENANRRALQEIHALLPELMAKDLLLPEGRDKLIEVVKRAARDDMPDY